MEDRNMTTKVTFLAFVRDENSDYYCYRVSSRNVERISDILQIAKEEFFKTSITARVVARYVWQHDNYRCVIDKS